MATKVCLKRRMRLAEIQGFVTLLLVRAGLGAAGARVDVADPGSICHTAARLTRHKALSWGISRAAHYYPGTPTAITLSPNTLPLKL